MDGGEEGGEEGGRKMTKSCLQFGVLDGLLILNFLL
jgi:hypothetical protein